MKTTIIIITAIILTGICPRMYSQEKGKIVFIQTFTTGAPLATPNHDHVFIDGNLVCALKTYQYSVHEVEAGEHTVAFQYKNTSHTLSKNSELFQIPVTVESGKTTYVELYLLIDKKSVWNTKGYYSIQEVTDSTFNACLKKKYKEKTECD